MKSGTIRVLALAVTMLLLSGCSSYNRKWKEAVQQPIPNDLSGPWEGHWISEVNGHNGKLRCLITPGATNHLDAHYHATYMKVLHFSYTVPLEARSTGDNFEFTGSADLGKMAGGVYTYEGSASPTNFSSTYASKYDHGRFEMSRPGLK